MANTVNDVMNVIASPDYGIKNIAGTNQEILAILEGTHKSKNNIHTIVNDIKTLLQKLVDTRVEKKPIEIGGNIAKLNNRHIQSILDEAKDIKKSLNNLTKEIIKQGAKKSTPAIAKLSDKASQKVADAMVKSIQKQNKGGMEGMNTLVDTFKKLKDISLKDIFYGKLKLNSLTKILKKSKENLNINKKDFENILKVINSAPSIIDSLSKISIKVFTLTKFNTIEKLKNILVGEDASLLLISKTLKENKSTFEKANEAAKNLKELISSLNKSMMKLIIASLLSKMVPKSIEKLNTIITEISSLSKTLIKNKKYFEEGSKAAKSMTVLVGNLLVTSIFLTVVMVTGLPALAGAWILKLIMTPILSVAKKLSQNEKEIGQAITPALLLTAVTGVMTITSLLLAKISETGASAIIGSIFMAAFVGINIGVFYILSKCEQSIKKGGIVMAIMGGSLILFGIALGKISDATKDMSWKQLGMIGTLTVGFGLAIAALGIPAVAGLIMLGSGVLGAMGLALYTFAKSLKLINDLGKVPTKTLNQVLNAMKTVRNFFIKNALKRKVVKQAKRYKRMMRPFGKTIKHLAKLKQIGSIPMKLVLQTLNAMRSISNYYKENPIRKKTIKQAKRYKKMMRPFGKMVGHLAKLKKMGSIPMKLVLQTLNAMRTIANYYVENPIKKKTIKQAKRYKKMMRPFGKMVNHLAKLKKMGSIPMKLVLQTLNAMRTIANYYVENPIKKKTIKQAKRYKKMMRPFGKMVGHLAKLKKIGSIPMKLVLQTLNAMSTIANYYANNPISKKAIKQAKKYKRIMKPFGNTVKSLVSLKEMGSIPKRLIEETLDVISTITQFYLNQDIGFFGGLKATLIAPIISSIIYSFGRTVKIFKNLKDLQIIPTESVENIMIAMGHITDYYNNVTLSKNINFKTEFTEKVVEKFTNMAKKIQDNFTDIKSVDDSAITSIVNACRSIINFYRRPRIFFATYKKIDRMNYAVENFSKIAKNVKDSIQGFSIKDLVSVNYAIKSLKRIIRFFKWNKLKDKQIRNARKVTKLLKDLSTSMLNLSNIDKSNLSSIGDTLTNTLDGVNKVDISQVMAVTRMFNAFNRINKSESIINKFAESVKEFTSTCKNLMDAMNYNTDAINNMDIAGVNGSSSNSIIEKNIIEIDGNNNQNRSGGVHITNVEELARTIAQQINGAISVDVPDTQVQLLINGTGGNEWTISRY